MAASNFPRVLILPGWRSSGPDHWQTRWEQAHGYFRVQQHEWERPLRGDWQIQLEEAVLADTAPVMIVAHSLGCHLLAAWAAHSRLTDRVMAALLVAPPYLDDLEELRQYLPSWLPMVRQRLPFRARVVASRNDPYATMERSKELADSWGAPLLDAGAAGHLNGESGLGDWPAGHDALLDLARGPSDSATSR